MIKCEIIQNVGTEQLIAQCISILIDNKISELPKKLKAGEKRILFKDDHTTVSLNCDGEHVGHFVLREVKGPFMTLFSTAKFKYQ